MPLLAMIPTLWPSRWANAQTTRRAVELLELAQLAAVDDVAQHVAHVVGRAAVQRHEVEQVVRGCRSGARGAIRSHGGWRRRRRRRDDLADDLQRVVVVVGEVVDDAGGARVDVAAAELLGGDLLAGRGLHQRRAAEEDRALLLDDHGLVAHRRDVGAAGGAGAHDAGDLRDLRLGHRRLVEEDPPEVLAVGEDVVLQRQERAAGVDEIDARQAVLQRHLLRAQVLLDGDRVVRAALDGRVVGDDHAPPAADRADAGDDPRARRGAVVELLRGERARARGTARPGRTAARCARARRACRDRGGAPPPSPRRRRARARAAARGLRSARGAHRGSSCDHRQRLLERDLLPAATCTSTVPPRGAAIESSIFIDSSTSSTSPSATSSPSATLTISTVPGIGASSDPSAAAAPAPRATLGPQLERVPVTSHPDDIGRHVDRIPPRNPVQRDLRAGRACRPAARHRHGRRRPRASR